LRREEEEIWEKGKKRPEKVGGGVGIDVPLPMIETEEFYVS